MLVFVIKVPSIVFPISKLFGQFIDKVAKSMLSAHLMIHLSFLLDNPIAVKPVTAKYLLNYMLSAKPAVNVLVNKKMEDYEQKLGLLC